MAGRDFRDFPNLELTDKHALTLVLCVIAPPANSSRHWCHCIHSFRNLFFIVGCMAGSVTCFALVASRHLLMLTAFGHPLIGYGILHVVGHHVELQEQQQRLHSFNILHMAAGSS